MIELFLENITKRFGKFVANDQIDLRVETGSIHAILGENGAGKTTLMNIISGVYQPDDGKIYLQQKAVEITSPLVAIQHGIGMIHQHFKLVPQLSVTENIILGTPNSFHLNLTQKATQIQDMAKAYGLDVPVHTKVADLSIGTQQRVEIIKVLYRQAKLLILDEPTAVLTPGEVESLLSILQQLAANQHTILFISHKLDEVMSICDTVTVLRQGKVVNTVKTQETTRQELAKMMVGREIAVIPKKLNKNKGDVILDVQDLEIKNDREILAVKGISFQLHRGEILGVAGVDGNGQRELADGIMGLRPITNGSIKLQDNINKKSTAYIPEDRQKMGLILNFTMTRNLILKAFRFLPFCRVGFLQSNIIKNNATSAIKNFDIRTKSPQIKAAQLSGGNQQKIILARELSQEPQLIVAMQPTRGLDIGATEYVQQSLLAQKEQGAAILYISTELEEVLTMSDRIAVIYEGQFVEILDAETATLEQIGLLMSSQKNI